MIIEISEEEFKKIPLSGLLVLKDKSGRRFSVFGEIVILESPTPEEYALKEA